MKNKILWILLAICLVGIIGGAVYVITSKQGVDTDLVLSPQNATSTVVIDHVNLAQNGYVVIQSVEQNRLSQIIEISSYLEKGEHNNVQISLGDFYTAGQEIIAVLYQDNGDQIFNDNDTVMLKDGNPTARYVKTGQSVPLAVMKSEVPMMSGHMMGENVMVTVHYTNTGFEPSKIKVPVNSVVQFINNSDRDMWVASNAHPQHDLLPTFDEFSTVKKGGSYSYLFDKRGVWPYHDHVNAAIGGVVEVF